MHVWAPERENVVIGAVQLPAEARGMARAGPNRAMYIIHRGVPDDAPFLPASPARLSVFDVGELRVSRVFDLERKPLVTFTAQPLDVSPDGREAWVANSGVSVVNGQLRIASSVQVYDALDGRLLAEIPMPPNPFSAGNTLEVHNVYFSPDGSTVWAAREPSGSVVVIDTRTRTVSANFPSAAGSADIAFNPGGTAAYVLGLRGVRVLNAATLSEIAVIPLEHAQRPQRLSLSPDGSVLFVRDDLAGLVWQINTEALAVEGTVEEFPGHTSVLAFGR